MTEEAGHSKKTLYENLRDILSSLSAEIGSTTEAVLYDNHGFLISHDNNIKKERAAEIIHSALSTSLTDEYLFLSKVSKYMFRDKVDKYLPASGDFRKIFIYGEKDIILQGMSRDCTLAVITEDASLGMARLTVDTYKPKINALL